MKFLVIARWKEENVPMIRERSTKAETPILNGKMLFPLHVIVGTNSEFGVVESNSIEDVVKLTWPWVDLMTFETRPIMDASEIMTFAKSANL